MSCKSENLREKKRENFRFVLHEKRSWDEEESFYSNFKMNLRDFINRVFLKKS